MHEALRRVAAFAAVVLLIVGALACASLTLAGILAIATNGQIVSDDSGVSAMDWVATISFGFAALGLLFGGWKMTARCWG